MFLTAFLTLLLFYNAKSSANLNIGALQHNSKDLDALVIGSGITGLTSSFYLDKYGLDIMLIDQSEFVGGNINSKEDQGYVWEEGPNSFQPNTPILRISKDVGIIDDLVLANPKLPRYIFWKNELHRLPTSIKSFFTSRLLSVKGKLRFVLGLLGFIKKKPKYEESIQEFITRHFGKEVFERLVDPFVSGVYAGNPSQLSIKATLKMLTQLESQGLTRGILEGMLVKTVKSLFRKPLKKTISTIDLPKIPSGSLGTFRKGIQSLPIAIKAKLGDKVKLRHKLIDISNENSKWKCKFQTPFGIKTLTAKALLITTPAYVTSGLIKNTNPKLSEQLGKIEYPPIAAVLLAYPSEYFKHDMIGFGHLIPRKTHIRTLGSIWSTSLFPGRAPPGETILTNFIGGAHDHQITSLSDELLIQQVDFDLKKIILKDNAPQPKVLGIKRWEHSIPQYNKGYVELSSSIKDCLQENNGLFLGGNYISGVSIGACIEYGMECADNIKEFCSNL